MNNLKVLNMYIFSQWMRSEACRKAMDKALKTSWLTIDVLNKSRQVSLKDLNKPMTI